MAVKSSYGAAEQEIRELFGDYLEGDGGRVALAIGAHAPSAQVRDAIEKSLEAFGYENDACTFAALTPLDCAADEQAATLDAHALFLLVEGLDPLHVIALDRATKAALEQAYRTNYPIDAPIRVFGRSSVAFEDLDSLLQTTQGKQKAWKVLKSLKP